MVNGVPKDADLYYKIPEHLEHHFKVWAAYRAEQATLLDSRNQRRGATAMLTAPSRLALVLPAAQPSQVMDTSQPQQVGDEQGRDCHNNRNEDLDLHQINTNNGMFTVIFMVLFYVTCVLLPVIPPPPPAHGQSLVHWSGPQSALAEVPTSTQSCLPGAASVKKPKRKKRCKHCLAHQCQLASECKGTGGEKWCLCISRNTHGRDPKKVRH